MVAINLGYVPRKWQAACHLGLQNKRWGVLVCSRRAGKTLLAVMHLIDRALKLQRADGRYAYIAPELKQAKQIAWSLLKHYALKVPGTIVSEGELHVTFSNGARIRLYGADNPDNLRGIYLDGAVLDEVAQLPMELWDSVLRPALSDRPGWGLIMGTCYGIDMLSKMYFWALDHPKEWFAFKVGVYEADSHPADEIASMREQMTEAAFAREMLCDFAAKVDNVLLSVDDVRKASARHYTVENYRYSPIILGVDPAAMGDDRTVIFPRQGLYAMDPYVFKKIDPMEIVAKLCQIDDQLHGADAIFIDDTGGYGGGVIARMRELGRQCLGVNFSSKADDDQYANKRAEMWWRMSTWIKEYGFVPNHQEIHNDLCAPTYGHNLRRQLLIESKEKMKARGIPSPDCADALALTFAYPVQSRMDRMHAGKTQPKALIDYDGLEAFRDQEMAR
jgi:hypothetical protein